ncbi:MAG: hypothetical protein WCG36_00560 [bacterium]
MTSGTFSSRQTASIPVRSQTRRKSATLTGLSPTQGLAPASRTSRIRLRITSGCVVAPCSGNRSENKFGFRRTDWPGLTNCPMPPKPAINRGSATATEG